MKNLNRFSFSGKVKKIEKLQDVPRLSRITIEINGLTIKGLYKQKINFEIEDLIFAESSLTEKAFVVEIKRIYKVGKI